MWRFGFPWLIPRVEKHRLPHVKVRHTKKKKLNVFVCEGKIFVDVFITTAIRAASSPRKDPAGNQIKTVHPVVATREATAATSSGRCRY